MKWYRRARAIAPMSEGTSPPMGYSYPISASTQISEFVKVGPTDTALLSLT